LSEGEKKMQKDLPDDFRFAPTTSTKTKMMKQAQDDAAYLDKFTEMVSKQKIEHNLGLQKNYMLYKIGVDMMRGHNLIPLDIASPVIYSKKYAQLADPNHRCHRETCKMRSLKRGTYIDPVTDSSFDADDDLYVCAGLFNQRENGDKMTLLPGSMKFHMCGSLCNAFEMSQHDVVEEKTMRVIHQSDDCGFCPITMRSRARMISNIPRYTDAPMSSKAINQIAQADYINYQESEENKTVGPIRRSRNRRSSRKTAEQRTADTNEDNLTIVLNILLSVESKQYCFDQSTVPYAIEKTRGFMNSRYRDTRYNDGLVLPQAYMIWNNLLNVHLKDSAPILFDCKERKKPTCERVRRVWRMIIESPYITQFSAGNVPNNSKKQKPGHSQFTAIATAVIFALADKGIFVNYHLPGEEFISLGIHMNGEDCVLQILPRDEDIGKAIIRKEDIPLALTRLKKHLKIDIKTPSNGASVIRECANSYIKRFSNELLKAIQEGAAVEDAMSEYKDKCASLVID
jgi:hypothetical protein